MSERVYPVNRLRGIAGMAASIAFIAGCSAAPAASEKPSSAPVLSPTPTETTLVVPESQAPTPSPTAIVLETPAPSLNGNERVNPVCVASHLNYLSREDADKQLSLMQEAGVAWTRFDFEWGALERSQGVWDFSLLDSIVSDAKSKGINVIAMLPQWDAPEWQRGGNGYESVIDTPENYASYAGAVAEHFKDKITYFELGNEPDLGPFWPSPKGPDVAAYAPYLKAGYTAIKAANPEAKVISAGISSEHNPVLWLQGLYDNGAKGFFDYFGYHPYSQPEGPTSERFTIMSKLTQTMENNGDKKGIIVSEIGWPTGTSDESVPEAYQAKDITAVFKDILHGNSKNVEIACVYDLVNDGTNPSSPEENFGLVNADYSHKPAFKAVKDASADFKAHFTVVNP